MHICISRWKRFREKRKTTVFNLYRAVLSTCLHKLSGQSKLIVGTPVAGRSTLQLQDQIGLYVNTLPLVSEYEAALPFNSYLKGISSDSLEVFNYQDYPLDLIVDNENIERDTSRNPLFDVMMVVQNTAIGDGSIDYKNQHGFTMVGIDNYLYGEAKMEHSDVPSKFDLSFNFALDAEKGYFIEVEYRTTLFRKNTIQFIYKAFEYILSQVISNSAVALGDINIIDEKEKLTILKAFNQPIGAHAENSILDLLSSNLETLGDTTALLSEDREVSYAELDQHSNSFANHLKSFENVDKVGLFLDRSEALMFSVLGALKAGKTYVPIDVNYPLDRIEYIINDAALQVIFTNEENVNRIPSTYAGEVVIVDSIVPNHAPIADAKNDKNKIAYVIYTSGSTGKPKGVELTHGNAIAFLKWANKEFADTPFELLYAATSYCFDLSIFEMFFPLSQGKAIRILKSAVEIGDYLPQDKKVF